MRLCLPVFEFGVSGEISAGVLARYGAEVFFVTALAAAGRLERGAGRCGHGVSHEINNFWKNFLFLTDGLLTFVDA